MAQPMDNKAQALELMGNYNATQEQVAQTLGISPGLVSQYMADPVFKAEVTARRFKKQQESGKRDNQADRIEGLLLDKLEQITPMIYRPMEVIHALSKVNALKRTNANNPELPNGNSVQVVLNLPEKLVQKFSVNIDNQVTSVGKQAMITISPQDLLKTVGASSDDYKTLEQISST